MGHADWTHAEARLMALGTAVGRVRSEAGVSGIAVDRLGRTVAALNHSVGRKQRLMTMREANQVTLDVAGLTAAYEVGVPVEVTRLDYYGRELEIWAEVGTTARLKATASGMRKFEALVARAERARTPKEYSPLASRVLEEVDRLESVFQR